nr:hypothetical protein [Herbidospora yilanensis]
MVLDGLLHLLQNRCELRLVGVGRHQRGQQFLGLVMFLGAVVDLAPFARRGLGQRGVDVGLLGPGVRDELGGQFGHQGGPVLPLLPEPLEELLHVAVVGQDQVDDGLAHLASRVPKRLGHGQHRCPSHGG